MSDDRGEPVTRLGPDSGGRIPGESNPRVYHWEWGPGDASRPGLPWIGIFLLVFGGLLLIQQAFPDQALGSLAVLAIGVAFLIKWAIDRGTGSLYAGAIITALAVPGLLNAAGIDRNGLSTFSFGVAFLFIAAVRAFSGGGWGWQSGWVACWRWSVPSTSPGRHSPATCCRSASSPSAWSSSPGARRAGPDSRQPEATAPATASIDPARTSAMRSSSASVTTNGGPSRIMSPSTPFACPCRE